MTYAQGRTIHDADGHVVEPPDWLFNYADRKMRDRIGMIRDGPYGPLGPNDIDEIRARRATPEMRASGDFDVMTDKMLEGLGAFEAGDRSEALDRLGFASQLMFPSFMLLPIYRADIEGDDTDFAYRTAEICNRAMADFCSVDPRMLLVSYLSLRDFERAKNTTRRLIASGTNALMISVNSPRIRLPASSILDPVWAQAEEAGIPIVLHVGAGEALIDPGTVLNGQPSEDIRYSSEQHFTAVSIVVAARAVMQTLSALIIDGVMDRFPRLKFGVIEHGAGWVPSWVRQLDMAHDAYFKLESRLHKLSLRPSEYVSRQVRVTPYPVDDVGWIIEQSGEDICMFSSDYPHFEGGRDPVSRFYRSINHLPEVAKQKFYCNNFVDLMGAGL